MDLLTVSVVLLWLAVLALALLLWALSRQVGVLFERVAPMGALVTDAGPAVGEPSPSFALRGIQSESVGIGGPTERATLLFFLSPTCPVCKKLLPLLRSLRDAERSQLAVVLASDGEVAQHEAYRRKQAVLDFPYVLSTELGMTYRIAKLPYAVLLDGAGVIRAKGLVNSREQLESLCEVRFVPLLGAQGFAVFLDGLAPAGVEAAHIAQKAGHQKVELCPQLAQMIFQRCPGQRQPMPCL